jgi:hypothetical protein
MDRTHRNQVRITVNMKNVPCVRSLASATIVRIRWILTAMWVWAIVTGKYCIPTQFKATQLVVAIAVWAIPIGLALKRPRLQPIDSTSQLQ